MSVAWLAGHCLQFAVGAQRAQVVGGAQPGRSGTASPLSTMRRVGGGRAQVGVCAGAGASPSRSTASAPAGASERGAGHEQQRCHGERSPARPASQHAVANTALDPPRCLRSPEQSAGILAEARRSKCDGVVNAPDPALVRRCGSSLGSRPMAGHQVLVLRIGVRIPAPQSLVRRAHRPCGYCLCG